MSCGWTSRSAATLPIQCRRCFGGSELHAHGAGQVGIRRLPGLGQGIAEDRGTKLRERGIRFAFEKLGQAVGIDAAGLVEGDRKGVGRRGDCRRRRGRDDAVAKDRAHAGEPAFEVVVLNAGHQPAIRVVGERSQVGAAVSFAFLAGFRVGRDGDDGMVDRPEVADEGRVGDAQPHLGLRPWAVCRLCAQDLAHSVAERQQGADDPSGLGGNPLPAPALLDGDRSTSAVDDLRQPPGLVDEVGTLLDRGTLGRGAGADGLVAGVLVRRGLLRRCEDVPRQPGKGSVEQLFQRRIVETRPAGVGRVRPVDAALLPVLAEHHLGMRGEIFVDLDEVVPRVARFLSIGGVGAGG
jgi:hypothetical protein